MIKVAEARDLVSQQAVFEKKQIFPLIEAAGLVLSAPVISPIDTPPFHQSAMDGYAFSFNDWDGSSALLLVGEVKAGESFSVPILPGEALRIFTGAPMPAGTDTVVIQEKSEVERNRLWILDDRLLAGSNVRPSGSQTKKNAVALAAGQFLSPAAVSFLASLGIEEVEAFAPPEISIIITGNELLDPGTSLSGGMIYESNSASLVAALNQLCIKPKTVQRIEDDRASISETIKQNLLRDMLILTGGISTGDHDFVKAALEDCGVREIFHSVKQKPGKPFYFGIKDHTLVFALPGNPAAVLTCFYEYIAPAIGQFTRQTYFTKTTRALAAEFRKKTGMTVFVKGKTNGDEVTILPNQESYKMNSFAVADCLIELEAEKDVFLKGEQVNIRILV